MGMDMVEVILGVEEAFDIEIRDEEAERISTVGQMYALVVSKLALNQPPRCASSAAFYPTRRALMGLSGAERRSIAPSTPMEGLLPARERRALWENLGRTVEARLPDLELPGWVNRLMRLFFLALLMAGVALYCSASISIVALYSLASVFCVWMAQQALRPLAIELPVECATVGGTVRAVVRLNQGLTAPKHRAWDPDETWATLRRVIAEQLDVPVEAIKAEAQFVDNLGAD